MPSDGLAGVVVYRDTGLARRGDRLLDLSSQQVAVLGVLAAAGGRVIGRDELQRRVGLSHRAPRRCDSLIVALRRVLGPGTIVTVRGRGWRCSGGVGSAQVSTSVPA